MIMVKILNRVQAGLHFYISLILATVQGYGLNSELDIKTYYVFTLQLVIKVFHTLKNINNTYMPDSLLARRLLFKGKG